MEVFEGGGSLWGVEGGKPADQCVTSHSCWTKPKNLHLPALGGTWTQDENSPSMSRISSQAAQELMGEG